uniref:Uncharacterized protein n=1 Tax=Cucumis sativus TaxID=3659 RepID=A0A0A0KNP5_CUCSA
MEAESLEDIPNLNLTLASFLSKGGTNSKGVNLVGWNKLTKPLSHGGLSIQGIGQNEAVLAEWIWWYFHEEGALWRQVINVNYGVNKDSSWPTVSFPEHIKGPWRTILHLNIIKERVTIKIGNGKNTSFWLDHRILTAPLSTLYPGSQLGIQQTVHR